MEQFKGDRRCNNLWHFETRRMPGFPNYFCANEHMLRYVYLCVHVYAPEVTCVK